MKTYKVHVAYHTFVEVVVDANNEEEAKQIAEEIAADDGNAFCTEQIENNMVQIDCEIINQ